jgi:hypothetical protein
VFYRKFFTFSSFQNPYVLKLPQLLSQFLYQSRKMDLPGIGSFTLDPAAVIPGDSDRDPHSPASGISFKNASITTPDDELIRFIQTHTGKMKPLAAADLDFFLTSGKQMLNIGKPFYLEGIGTLVKVKDGRLDFVPGEYSTARLEEPGPTKRERAEKKQSTFDGQRPSYEPRTNSIRQLLLLAGIIGGLVIIGWGGYSLYKKNTLPEPVADRPQAVPPHEAATPPPDTVVKTQTPPPNSPTTNPATGSTPGSVAASTAVVHPPAALPPGPGMIPYKFVILETAHRGRALRRYNQLLGFQLNIKMEQKDSSDFKLYFPIAAAARDTTHIKDSLADVYAAHVRIER